MHKGILLPLCGEEWGKMRGSREEDRSKLPRKYLRNKVFSELVNLTQSPEERDQASIRD